jgi:hypothetical protein
MGNTQSGADENIIITRRSTWSSDAPPKEKHSITNKASPRQALSTSTSQSVISSPALVTSSHTPGILPPSLHNSTLTTSVSLGQAEMAAITSMNGHHGTQPPTDSNHARAGIGTSERGEGVSRVGGVGSITGARTCEGAGVGTSVSVSASLPSKRHSLDLPHPHHSHREREMARNPSWRHSGERAKPKSHEKMKEKLRKVGDRNQLNKSQDNTTRPEKAQPDATTTQQDNTQRTKTTQLDITETNKTANKPTLDKITRSDKTTHQWDKTTQPEKVTRLDKNVEESTIEMGKIEAGKRIEEGRKLGEERKAEEGNKVEEGEIDGLNANVRGQQRSRGYTHVGFSAFSMGVQVFYSFFRFHFIYIYIYKISL